MEYQPISKLADKIIMPGIDKHIQPLVYFKGSSSLGRVHRLWNLILAAKAQGCDTISDIVKFSHNPEFSHLCETTYSAHMLAARGFMSRLRLSPKVTGNVPEFTEWCAHILPTPWEYHRVSSDSAQRRCAWWRSYRPTRHQVPGNVSDIEASARQFYPFIAYDPRRSEGADLITAVNTAVPRNIPEDIRADICQDIVCAVLVGDLRIEDIKGGIVDFIKSGRKMFADKWRFSSYDAPMPGTDDFTLADILAAPDEWEFNDY